MTKCVILAGGLGSRLSEETVSKPKPMVEIGGRPILWHIMKHYSHYGINDFIICLGYKGYLIKEYFFNFSLHNADFTIDLKTNEITSNFKNLPNWKVTLIDTGENTLTGGRLLRLKEILKNEKYFCMTYGDGVSDINIKKLISFHVKQRKFATMSIVTPPGRFGSVKVKGKVVTEFSEKNDTSNSFINGGFFVLSPEIFKFINNDNSIWEQEPLKKLSSQKQLISYHHKGFWHAMDTLRDRNYLENLWTKNIANWKIWDEN